MEKYKGEIGPIGGMSAVDDRFSEQYKLASDAIIAIIDKFEKNTGRVVKDISLVKIETTGYNTGFQYIKQIEIDFLPIKEEVDW